MKKILDFGGAVLELEGTSLFENGRQMTPSVRKVSDMTGVLLTRNFITERNRDDVLYYMYRGAAGSEDDRFKSNSIRYDITIIKKYALGNELNKTVGHYHPIAEAGLSYPELYEVVEGNALFIFQKKWGSRYLVDLIHAESGEKVLVMPNYGHITVNEGSGDLVLANLTNDSFRSDYAGIKEMHGGAVFALSDGSIMLNKTYRNISLNARDEYAMPVQLGCRSNMYECFVEDPSKFDFLNRPTLLELMQEQKVI